MNSLIPNHKIILFDLGGVLLELGAHPVHPDWFHSDVAIAFEQGRLSADAFADAMIEALALTVSRQELLTHFAAWLIGIYPEVNDTLTKLKSTHTLAFLSNTNEVHWPRIISEFGFEQLFTHTFASHHLQLSKPDPAIFHHVLTEMNVDAGEVLFYDDNPANIAVASALGIDAKLVKGFNAVLNDLTNRQLITRG